MGILSKGCDENLEREPTYFTQNYPSQITCTQTTIQIGNYDSISGAYNYVLSGKYLFEQRNTRMY